MYFDYGYPALEALCYGFASWYVGWAGAAGSGG